jgi:hypothetical protein
MKIFLIILNWEINARYTNAFVDTKTLEKTEGTIKNGQSKETQDTERRQTKHRKIKTKGTTRINSTNNRW